jgi:DNA-binding MarR family transcriptional regulator|tara:strand:+ start:234 stop:533 length:300 start_codon:yes stop_codon:yes gene_type:complete
MNKKTQSLGEVWALLRYKEKENGLDHLSLTERDILESILYSFRDNKELSLNTILKNNNHPRATFFRSLKKLRDTNYLIVSKEDKDKRKSIIYLTNELKA